MKAAQGEGRPLLRESLVSLPFKLGWRPEAGARKLAHTAQAALPWEQQARSPPDDSDRILLR